MSMAQDMKEKFNLPQTEKEIQKGVQKVAEDFYTNDAQLKPGILEFIQKLHQEKIPMVVASSGIRALIYVAFTRLDLHKYFKKILTGDKNSPELFEKCLEELGTKAEETFVFEDDESADLNAMGELFTRWRLSIASFPNSVR